MYAQVDKPEKNKSKAVANSGTQRKLKQCKKFAFEDNRPSLKNRNTSIVDKRKNSNAAEVNFYSKAIPGFVNGSKALLQKNKIIQKTGDDDIEITIFNRGRNQHIEMIFIYKERGEGGISETTKTVHAHLCGWGREAKSSERIAKTAGSGSGGTGVFITEAAEAMWAEIQENNPKLENSTVTVPYSEGIKALEFVRMHSGGDGSWPGQFSVILGNLGIPWFVNCHSFALNALKEGGVAQDWKAWLKSWYSPRGGLQDTGIHRSSFRNVWIRVNKVCEKMLDDHVF